ncbi:MAG: SCO family protein [Proteobacteria bacterium]|nr:SCO family protein [Pseudomonadota bacterium]
MFRIGTALALAGAVFALNSGATYAHDAHRNGHGQNVAAAPDGDRRPAISKADVATIYGLTDQHGVPVNRDRFKGRFSFVVFGYTACPDVCPTAMTHVASIMEKLGPYADYMLPVFVTFDPARDTAEVLRDYVSHFDKRTLALTGSAEAIKAVQQGYGVLSVPGPKDEDGSYFISHTAAKYLIAPDGSHLQSFSHDDPPEQIAVYLKKIFSRMGM